MICRVMDIGWSFWRWRWREAEETMLAGALNQVSVGKVLPSTSIVDGGVVPAALAGGVSFRRLYLRFFSRGIALTC